MSEAIDRPSRRDELVFFGSIAASLCHELKNVFATIGELSGLLYDLGCASEAKGRLSSERLRTICDKIGHQVERGEDFTRLLSRFAHSVDEPINRIDLGEVAAQTVELSRRFCYINQVALECVRPGGEVMATVNPYACEHAIFVGIRLAFLSASENRKVTVSVARDDTGPMVVVSSADPFGRALAESDDLALLEGLVAQLGGRMSWIADSGRNRLVLHLCSKAGDSGSAA